jgi:ABC-type phosphate transport system substrate-binding protein
MAMKFNHSIAGALLTTMFLTSARAELVVIVNPRSPAASMTPEEVADVYLGKNASFAPVDLPESGAARADFYKKVAGKDSAQVKALWARLVFTGRMQPPKEVSSSSEALKYVAGNDKAIAYIEKSAVDSSVKAVLTVN